jgi:hypothetical protein
LGGKAAEDELGLAEDELGGGAYTLDELGGGTYTLDELGTWQLETICAAPALTNSIQEESDICEQVPAANWHKT